MEIPGILRLTAPAGPFAPVLLSVPHAGRDYAGDFKTVCPLPLLRQTEDSYVDELVARAARHGAAMITALFPRALIDVNRAVHDLDPAVIDGVWPEPLSPGGRTLQGLGLVRRLCRNGVPMYDAPLPVEEIERRLRQFYHPYHRVLARELANLQRRFDETWLIDCHSMPSQAVNGSAAPSADFVLGDRDGAACDPGFTELAARILRSLGYRVAVNDPYKGMEILRRYGRPAQKQHALQVEINRALYLDETNCERTAEFNTLCDDLDNFFGQITSALAHRFSERLAAE